jgi:hypothetical protein
MGLISTELKDARMGRQGDSLSLFINAETNYLRFREEGFDGRSDVISARGRIEECNSERGVNFLFDRSWTSFGDPKKRHGGRYEKG